jgi:hypothetical protein
LSSSRRSLLNQTMEHAAIVLQTSLPHVYSQIVAMSRRLQFKPTTLRWMQPRNVYAILFVF